MLFSPCHPLPQTPWWASNIPDEARCKIECWNDSIALIRRLLTWVPGADSVFLERGFKCTCIRVWGDHVADFISFFFNIHENEIDRSETKLFHFHRIFNDGWAIGGSSEPREPPLEPPLGTVFAQDYMSKYMYMY